MFEEFGFDGLKALEAVVATSKYGNIYQAVAALSVFSHPKTCAQLKNSALFPVIRQTKTNPRETFTPMLMYDDNTAPTDAFLWANGISRTQYRELQFNHIYADSANANLYTNLCNLVVTPAFLAKLTDKHVAPYLKYRAFQLYGFAPEGEPQKPVNYDALKWSPPLNPVENLEAMMRKSMTGKDNRTVRCARKLGWYFSQFQPDVEL